jgi:hypothetical protein
MVEGKKQVEWIPPEWVEQGREFKDAMAELFAANARLLALGRQQSRAKKPKKR